VQQLAGVVNWIRPYLSVTIVQLAPLFALLWGDSDLLSPWQLTPEVQALDLFEQALGNKQVYYFEETVPVPLYIMLSDGHPVGILGQRSSAWPDPLHIL
ncbi:PO113 protein, partial [Sakesphorus luctuosus]|nr:PO113 protein [Sakesphorus luctuosus]